MRLVVSIWLCLALMLPAAASEPWRAAAFRADPAQVLSAARALPGSDAEAEVLLDQEDHSFDAQGREVSREHLWIRILQPSGIDRWGTVTYDWEPWYQQRPEVRARVIGADGAVHLLDPKTIAVAPLAGHDDTVLTDGRQLKVPLPAVSVGAVIELEATTRDREPGFSQVALEHVYLQRRTPVRRLELSVEATAPSLLKVQGEHLTSLPSPVRQGATTRWRLIREDLPAVGGFEAWMPADDLPVKAVWISTGRSWSQVADAYSAIVDRQIAAGPVSAKALWGEAHRDRRAAVEHALAWVQAQIRYTGIEFGEAAVVPRPPAETVKRRFGDCKDMATLLVALLRSEGIEAHVALLRAGWGEVPRQLPGASAFDHAIVHVSGAPELWLDATSPYRPAGELPGGDQDRPALIARKGEHRLVRTPTSGIRENRTVIERELFFPEEGPIRVVERRTSTGGAAATRRARLHEQKPDALAKQEAHETQEAFGASADRVDRKQVADLSRPLVEEREVKKATFLEADPEAVSVPLRIMPVFEALPDVLTTLPDEATAHREHGLQLPPPTLVELRYRVHPAPEFVAGTLPQDETLPLGPATLRRHYEQEQDGTLLAVASFDPGPARYSAAQVMDFWKGFRKWGDSNVVSLELTHAGKLALDQGKPKEALAAYRRSAALHPKEALHHWQLSQLLLDLGFGEPARKEAEEGVRLAPKDARAHRKLGWILEHDPFGQRFGPGADLAGARREYEAAIALDPKSVTARASLAILLEYDAKGRRYAPGVSLDRSIHELLTIHGELKSKTFEGNLLVDLAKAGRFAELVALAPSLKQSSQRDILWVASTAKVSGIEAAVDRAEKLTQTPKTRRETLQAAAGVMIIYREYPTATKLLEVAAQGADEPGGLRAQAEAIRRVERVNLKSLQGWDPATLLKRLLASFVLPSEEPHLVELFVKPIRDSLENDPEAKRALHSIVQTIRSQFDSSSLPPEAMLDIALSKFEYYPEGDPKIGVRVRMLMGKAGELHWYLAPDEGHLAVVAGGKPLMVAELGGQALAAYRRGDLAAAKQWLAWEAAEVGAVSDRSAQAAFVDQWREAKDDPKALEVAAALGALGGTWSAAALPIVRAWRAKADPARRARIDQALAVGYSQLERYQDLADVTGPYLDEPNSDLDFMLFLRARMNLDEEDRSGLLEAAAKARLARDPDDRAASQALLSLTFRRGEYAKGLKQVDALIAAGRAGPDIYNDRAWYGLAGQVGSFELEAARKANELSDQKSGAILNTLAAVEASLGHVLEAEQYLRKELEVWPDHEPVQSDWWIHGRMAEELGMPEVARADYARALKGLKPSERSYLRRLVEQRTSRLH